MNDELIIPDGSARYKGTCKYCNLPVGVVLPVPDSPMMERLHKLTIANLAHDKCLQARQVKVENGILASNLQRSADLRAQEWRGICPDEFRKTLDFSRPSCRRQVYQDVMAWVFGQTGLLIHGPTGNCKTRFMYQLAEREYLTGRKILIMTHPEFRMKLSALASDDQDRLRRWVGYLSSVDILCIDDFGKGTVTPASEEATCEVIDSRVKRHKPIWYTTNGDLQSLKGQFSEERGAPMLRRIMDFTKRIPVGLK